MPNFKLEISDRVQNMIQNNAEAYRRSTIVKYNNRELYQSGLKAYYSKIIKSRHERMVKVASNNDYKKTVLHYISKKEHIVDACCDWFWTFDPRLVNDGLPTTIPWILFPRQVEFIEWLLNHYLDSSPGLIEKSRDQGVTWLFCLVMLHLWRWEDGFIGGIGSNKLENVDTRGNSKSIFEKIRTIIKYLPNWWLPIGFKPRQHDKTGNLINPENGNNIMGEGGDEIGRGGRTSMYLVDEAASVEHPLLVDASLSQNTNCQMDLSTPKGPNPFGEKRHSGRVDVFTFHWRDDPRKNDEWYRREKARLDPVVLAQEVDIDYHASVEGICIKPEWVDAAMEIELDPEGICSAGLDVGAGGADASALAVRTGPVVEVQEFNEPNGINLTHTALDICTERKASYLQYDAPGVGHAVKSALDSMERKIDFLTYGLQPGGAVSDSYYEEFRDHAKNVFLNARAEWWWQMGRRLEKTYEHFHGIKKYDNEDLCSLPRNTNLKNELCSPMKMRTDNGKIKIESKVQMKRRHIKSPNMAEAVIMAFVPRDAGHKHVINEKPILRCIKDLTVQWGVNTRHRTLHYGAISQSTDIEVNGLCAIWDEHEARLFIYDEFHTESPIPSILAKDIIDRMHLRNVPIRKLLGNNRLMLDEHRTFFKEMNREFYSTLEDFQIVKIKPPKRYDAYGSVSILNQIIMKNKLVIGSNCVKLKEQLMNWTIEQNKIKDEGIKQCLLMIVSELQQIVDIKELLRHSEYKKRFSPESKHETIAAGMPPMGL